MKISGFTVVRNAELMGYPVRESIRSALPLVDEFVIGVGQSDDHTKDMILSLGDPKIRVFDSHWDLSKTKGGLILSQKTNEALAQCQNDWCLYLQADEVLHERDHTAILDSAAIANSDPRVEGLLFSYVHFYGSFQVVATSRKWYRREVRMVRKSSGIQSAGDAQSFRVQDRKPLVIPTTARIFHYGWVKPPQKMGQKKGLLNYWWHGNSKKENPDEFEYEHQYGLRIFNDTHPKVMGELVSRQDWNFQPRRTLTDWSLKDLNLWASDVFERAFHYRIGEYKPYQVVTTNAAPRPRDFGVQNGKNTN